MSFYNERRQKKKEKEAKERLRSQFFVCKSCVLFCERKKKLKKNCSKKEEIVVFVSSSLSHKIYEHIQISEQAKLQIKSLIKVARKREKSEKKVFKL